MELLQFNSELQPLAGMFEDARTRGVFCNFQALCSANERRRGLAHLCLDVQFDATTAVNDDGLSCRDR